MKNFAVFAKLELNFTCKSIAILGPNGSGKSGVVDAIEFALTGNVSRLSGVGTGGISLTRHGPHVLQRDNPAAAKVSLTISLPGQAQDAVLTRTVKSPNQYVLDPNTPESVAAISWASEHPELTLSRREVMKYVSVEPGKRAQEVQALLKLDRVDQVRRLLRTVMTKTSSAANGAESELKAAEDAMRRHLDLTTLLTPDVTAVMNKHRRELGLDDLDTVTARTDISAGPSVKSGQDRLNKVSALRDLEALNQYIVHHDELTKSMGELTESLAEIEADSTILDSLRHRDLVAAGIPLVVEAECPLCNLRWPDVDALRVHLATKLARSEAAAQIRDKTLAAASALKQELSGVRALIQVAQPHAAMMGKTDLQADLTAWVNELVVLEEKLTLIDTVLEEAARLAENPLRIPRTVSANIESLRSALNALPDQSAADAARTFLTVAQERWTRIHQARSAHNKASAARATAQAVYETYNDVADASLMALYKSVEANFSSYYQQINSDDESSFKAGLLPSGGKLDLEVDFYGLGMFPPLAYHSEGHQDGMGVCLYLALVGELLKGAFRLAVLDDVVTSIDTNHRREFL